MTPNHDEESAMGSALRSTSHLRGERRPATAKACPLRDSEALSKAHEALYEATAYIDTIEIFFPPFLSREQLQTLRRFGILKPCRDKKGELRGWRLCINQPKQAQIIDLDRIAGQYRGILSRVDLAYDMHAPLMRRIATTAVLKWRRRGPMYDEENKLCWTDYRQRRRPSRDLSLYGDKANRRTGKPDCVHFELRFLHPRVIRSHGVKSIKDLISLNPRQLLERNVKWSDAGDTYVERFVRSAVAEDRRRRRGKEVSRYADRYRSQLAGRVRSLLLRLGEDRSQIVFDASRRRRIPTIPTPFLPPEHLTWPGTPSDNSSS